MSDKILAMLARKHGTPLYVYSAEVLREYAQKALAFKAPFGLTVRYAIKANPHKEIVQLFDKLGLMFDASSEGEVNLLLGYGIDPSKVALNSQQLPKSVADIYKKGVYFTATSLHQLEEFGQNCGGQNVGVRLNPGVGSGANNKVLTAGVTAGFGIWHEYIPKILEIANKHQLKIDKVHTHIGAGTDPVVWQEVADITIKLADHFKDVSTISLGGGFKVARVPDEQTADLGSISQKVAQSLTQYHIATGRKLHLEIEPGTYLTALAGVLITEIVDIVDTGTDGYNFIKTNTGMNDFLRPTLYGAQHPIKLLSNRELGHQSKDYVVIGHNCESGDLLTPQKDHPENITTITLPKAQIGDYLVIGGAGAYCASMSAKGYNSFEDAKEVVIA